MKRRELLHILPAAVAGLTVKGLTAEAQPGPGILPGPPYHVNGGERLPIAYLRKVRGMLQWIRETQSDVMLEASYALARTWMKGGTVWCEWDMGHNNNFDIFPERNGVPEFISMVYDTDKAKKGDLYFASREANLGDDLAKKDIFVVGSPAPWGGDAKGWELLRPDVQIQKLKPFANIWIETNITTHGAIMKMPGQITPFGPVSGILGLMTFWMIVGDACRILAREGKKVKVSGDEPELKSDRTDWIDLDTPIMGTYFDQTMRQLEMIEGEIGALEKAASMAVDAVLSGGKVFSYSNNRNSLAVEGHGRRGGLFLTRGLCMWEGKLCVMDGYQPYTPNPKDFVVMGVWRPENPVDLENLARFRSADMKTASIGPMTRDFTVPAGATVPMQTDVHIGRMCDTYGLFAVPGFNRRICPTSGTVMNQIWWALCMEIAAQIINRTGDVPAVWMSGALAASRYHNPIMNAKYLERGY